MDQQLAPSSDPTPTAPPTEPPRKLARLVTVEPWSRSPLIWIWVRPRRVVRARIDAGMRWHVILLPVIASWDNALGKAADRSLGDRMSMTGVLAVTAIVGLLVGLFSFVVVGWLLGVTGRSLGGRGTNREARIAYCWACAPLVWSALLWAPLVVTFGSENFQSEMPTLDESPWSVWLVLSIAAISAVIGLWTMVIGVKAVAEAHRFSAWRALAASVYATALLLGAVLAVSLGAVILFA